MFEYMQYNVLPWGRELAIYFFLVGMAAMTFVLAAAPNVFGGGTAALQPTQKIASVVVLVLLAVCGVILIEDLGQPGRFLYPLLYFHVSSPLSWGSLFVVLFGLAALVFAFAVFTGRDGLLRPVGIAGSVLALLLPLYTGWDLMANQARELWHSPAIPLMFVALSVNSGVALMSVIAMATGAMNEETAAFLRRVLAFSLVATLVIFIAGVLRVNYGSAEEQIAWQIINEEFGTKFWLLSLVVGVLVPLVLVLVPGLGASPAMITLAAVLATIGAYTYREVYLLAGQLPMLTF
ncbi:NrfD/PsrC family molybdoenzyme membrane anchor subunit [Inmirania thermothiophila]|uniref:Ni/Fe-hydrogenase subunit HybB-like protein n=1 Tax=Inmirania thermothiophila TaxID=1750597 RepID=A0A3N1Y321_9GAMM|nr:NrfD/PsrC family molybdoenzyme membrane anchor subunit [Inmirania thermothiophila]ROR31962.1 Ni/Fe-hydrogenase subunit HybB-like protein [Inmirania thermothiophila]